VLGAPHQNAFVSLLSDVHVNLTSDNETKAKAPLGLSLSKSIDGNTVVTRIVPGGEAERVGVQVGTYVIGVNGTDVSKFDEIMALVPKLPRPVRFKFRKPLDTRNRHEKCTIAAPPPPISANPMIDLIDEVVFHQRELGCTFQISDTHGHCIVASLENGKNLIFDHEFSY